MNKNLKFLSALMLVSLALGGAGCSKKIDDAQKENLDNIKTEQINDSDIKETEETGVEVESVKVTVVPQGIATEFTVQADGIEVGKITRKEPSNVSLEKIMKQYAYIGLNYDGLGGRILYAGPDEVYRVNLKTKQMDKIYSEQFGFFCDVSPDETKIAYIGTNPDGYELDVKNLQTNEKKNYLVYSLGEYGSLMGDATFSPEGDKIALGAASSDPEHEKSAIYMVMLGSEKVIKITEKEGVTAYYVKQWLNNDEVEYTK